MRWDEHVTRQKTWRYRPRDLPTEDVADEAAEEAPVEDAPVASEAPEAPEVPEAAEEEAAAVEAPEDPDPEVDQFGEGGEAREMFFWFFALFCWTICLQWCLGLLEVQWWNCGWLPSDSDEFGKLSMLQQWVHTWHVRQKSLEDKIRQLIYGSVGDAKLGKLATKHTDLDITPPVLFFWYHTSQWDCSFPKTPPCRWVTPLSSGRAMKPGKIFIPFGFKAFHPICPSLRDVARWRGKG